MFSNFKTNLFERAISILLSFSNDFFFTDVFTIRFADEMVSSTSFCNMWNKASGTENAKFGKLETDSSDYKYRTVIEKI